MLCKHYGKAPVIIIDEYDTPIKEGYAKDFYDEMELKWNRGLSDEALERLSNGENQGHSFCPAHRLLPRSAPIVMKIFV